MDGGAQETCRGFGAAGGYLELVQEWLCCPQHCACQTAESSGRSWFPSDKCPLLPNRSCAMRAFNNSAPRLGEDVQARRVPVPHCLWQAFTHKNHPGDIGRAVLAPQLVLICKNKPDIVAGSRLEAWLQSKQGSPYFLWPALHPLLW